MGRLAGLSLLAAIAVVSGCGGDPNRATIVNDLDEPVRLKLCSSNDCEDEFNRDETLPPGEDWDVNVSAIGVPNVYLVESPGERARLGCLPLVSPEKRPRIVVRVSENVPCRDELDEDAFWPARWRSSG